MLVAAWPFQMAAATNYFRGMTLPPEHGDGRAMWVSEGQFYQSNVALRCGRRQC